jgi:sirohydrochlorin cobaltochelatase
MLNAIERALEAALTDRFLFGQILVRKTSAGSFVISHRDDESRSDLQPFRKAGDAAEIARYDDANNYRPLKTAPNLRHGWRMELTTPDSLRFALDHFYPGRLAAFATWKVDRLPTTPLRETLERQSGMYRIAADISDEQINQLVGDFCRSDGGCLRTILWKRDAKRTIPSTQLPPEKFDPARDQALGARSTAATTVPLLCQEACNLLVAAARKVVKSAP